LTISDKASFALRCALAAGFGSLGAFSLAPFHWMPLLFLAFTGLFWLVSRARRWSHAAFLGWLFGVAHFAVGLGWIAESFYVDATRFGTIAVPAIAALVAFLALFPALACGLAKATGARGWRLLLALAVFWSGAELLRGHVLTGFPWNLIGYAWGGASETLQAASVLGIYGLGFLTILLAAAPGLAIGSRIPRSRRWIPLAVSMMGVLALWTFGAHRLAGEMPGDVLGSRLRIVQANVPQAMKWNPEESERILSRYVTLSSQAGSDWPTHIVWPETAVPYLIEEAKVSDAIVAAVPIGGTLLTGAVRRTPDFEWHPALLNSILGLSESGEIVAAYDKVRLVPFGEYMPLRRILPFKKLTEGTIDYVSGDERVVFSLPDLPAVMPMICYEAIFPDARWQGQQPEWILNVTNDAWFGDSSGPYQHFLAARVRAIERGVPLIRAANTGISAVTDAYGRVRASLRLNTSGIIDTTLPGALRNGTLYTSLGNLPLGVALVTSFLVIFLTRPSRGE
jgi:apolipoprotein N-acyltransferase